MTTEIPNCSCTECYCRCRVVGGDRCEACSRGYHDTQKKNNK